MKRFDRDSNADVLARSESLFEEQFDLGLTDEDSYAKINVPNFKDGSLLQESVINI